MGRVGGLLSSVWRVGLPAYSGCLTSHACCVLLCVLLSRLLVTPHPQSPQPQVHERHCGAAAVPGQQGAPRTRALQHICATTTAGGSCAGLEGQLALWDGGMYVPGQGRMHGAHECQLCCPDSEGGTSLQTCVLLCACVCLSVCAHRPMGWAGTRSSTRFGSGLACPAIPGERTATAAAAAAADALSWRWGQSLAAMVC